MPPHFHRQTLQDDEDARADNISRLPLPVAPPRRLSRADAAKAIVQEAMAGDDGDPLQGLNHLDRMMFAHAHVNLAIPVLDPVETRHVLKFLIEGMQGLMAQMDRLPERRSKSLLVQTTVHNWSRAIKKKALKGTRP